MNNSLFSSRKARVVGPFIFLTLLLQIFAAGIFAQAADAPTVAENNPRNLAAARTAPPELPPTQESVRRDKMRAQLKIEGENRFRYAREMHADGYLVRSRQLLQDFLILFPKHDRRFSAFEMLARIEEQQDHPERAVSAYRRAYAAVPGEDRGLDAALRAGRILAGLGRLDEAKAIFLEIQARKPDSRMARLVEIEMRALGLPVIYEAVDTGVNTESGNNKTATGDDVRQNPTPVDGSGVDQGNSDRGLLDGTDGVPVDDRRSGDADTRTGVRGERTGDSRSNSTLPGDSGQNQMESGSADGSVKLSNEALQRMGEGVEQP